MGATCLPEVMDGIENELGSLELRGVTDMEDGSIDHLFQIGALIAAAQEMRAKEGHRWDMWEVNESTLKLIRHVRVWRNEMLDPRIKLANKSPVPITGKWSRLTGERVTFNLLFFHDTVVPPFLSTWILSKLACTLTIVGESTATGRTAGSGSGLASPSNDDGASCRSAAATGDDGAASGCSAAATGDDGAASSCSAVAATACASCCSAAATGDDSGASCCSVAATGDFRSAAATGDDGPVGLLAVLRLRLVSTVRLLAVLQLRLVTTVLGLLAVLLRLVTTTVLGSS
eukprot:s2812_g7.t1